MITRESECPVCNHPVTYSAPAVISPWIRKLGVRSFISTYFLCANCETGFFSKRYNQQEMRKIYQNYRGPSYVSLRSNWEPWYSETYNEEHESMNYVALRKSSLTKFLKKHSSGNLEIVVDVGGGAGEFIPEIATQKIVVEFSDKKPLPGVIRFKSLGECPDASLIIYSHVLEHVASPQRELEELFKKSSALYVEVPYGIPEINENRRNVYKFLKHIFSSFFRKLWSTQTEPSTGREISSDRMLTQSEHLTFFSEKSIKTLAVNLGAVVQVERNTINTPDFKSGTVLQCFFTRR